MGSALVVYVKISVMKTFLLTLATGLLGSCLAAQAKTPELITQNLSAYSGQQITIFGRLSRLPHQHLLAEGLSVYQIAYVDADQADQFVAYFLQQPSCEGVLSLQGQVLEVKGGSKRPDQTSKLDASYHEYQLQVESYRCLLPDTPAAWLHQLGLKAVSPEQKQLLLSKLRQAGKDVIPLLIRHLGDQRLFGTRLNIPAAAVNAPVTARPADAEPTAVTVSQIAEELLYQVIMPVYTSAYSFRGKPVNQDILHVRDWTKWWAAHQHQSLEEIHQALIPVVDRYWQQKGSVQVLD